MKKEIEKLLEEINAETVPDRIRISLYMSRAVFRQFQKDCGQRSASRIAEKLFRWFSRSNQYEGQRGRNGNEV